MIYRRPATDIWGNEETEDGTRFRALFDRANFDPATMTMLTVGSTVAGGALSAAGTLAGGSNAAQIGRMRQGAAEYQATQDVENSASEIASAGRRAIETGQQAKLVGSRAVATTAAGGVNAGTGSPLTNEAQIANRGRYAAALDIFNGQNAATADLNKATAAHYTGQMDVAGGDMAREASEFAAAGTLAGSGASAFRMYGMRGGGGYDNNYGPPLGVG